MRAVTTAGEYEFVGFWSRVLATLLDGLVLTLLLAPLLWLIYGSTWFELMVDNESPFAGTLDFIIRQVLPPVAIIACWIKLRATPGKMAVRAQVLDADTGNSLTPIQAVSRYFGYIVSSLPLGLGFIWIAFHPQKRGWHDLLARTVVVRPVIRTVHFGVGTMAQPSAMGPTSGMPLTDAVSVAAMAPAGDPATFGLASHEFAHEGAPAGAIPLPPRSVNPAPTVIPVAPPTPRPSFRLAIIIGLIAIVLTLLVPYLINSFLSHRGDLSTHYAPPTPESIDRGDAQSI